MGSLIYPRTQSFGGYVGIIL